VTRLNVFQIHVHVVARMPVALFDGRHFIRHFTVDGSDLWPLLWPLKIRQKWNRYAYLLNCFHTASQNSRHHIFPWDLFSSKQACLWQVI